MLVPIANNCNRDATVQRQVSPDYPESARGLGLGQVTVVIRVYINPDGKAVAWRVTQSSGNVAIDQEAGKAAVQSTYTPRLKNCKPAAGLYLFKVTFSPGG